MSQKPNILSIIADDHQHNTIQSLGNPTVQMPVLDSLVADGTVLCKDHIMGSLSDANLFQTANRATLQFFRY